MSNRGGNSTGHLTNFPSSFVQSLICSSRARFPSSPSHSCIFGVFSRRFYFQEKRGTRDREINGAASLKTRKHSSLLALRHEKASRNTYIFSLSPVIGFQLAVIFSSCREGRRPFAANAPRSREIFENCRSQHIYRSLDVPIDGS